MNESAKQLAVTLVQNLKNSPENSSRFLVGLCGIPGSGKSTFAKVVIDYTNKRLLDEQVSARAILVGLDGWHLSRAQLDEFSDRKLAYDRRGIHWTFDSKSYLEFIQSCKSNTTRIIEAPSFDHAIGDPIPGAIIIQPHHKIILVEGLYTLLSVGHWKEAGLLLDERWYLAVPDTAIAKNRLVKRHVQTGVAKDEEEAIWRLDENDLPNGVFVVENMLPPTRVVHSVDDEQIVKSSA